MIACVNNLGYLADDVFFYFLFGGRFIGHSDDVRCLFNVSWICNHQGAMAILLVYSSFIGDLLPICVCSTFA
jgi:hypothetical protein